MDFVEKFTVLLPDDYSLCSHLPKPTPAWKIWVALSGELQGHWYFLPGQILLPTSVILVVLCMAQNFLVQLRDNRNIFMLEYSFLDV